MFCKTIVVTCSTTAQAHVVRTELDLLQRKQQIDSDTQLLVVEDAGVKVGSGSATLNALLVATEHLCARANYQVVTADVLRNAQIYIFHLGREYPFDPCGKGFIALPISEKTCFASTTVKPCGVLSNLEFLIKFVNQLAVKSPPGVWVCSTDMFLKGQPPTGFRVEDNCDVAMFSTWETIDYATKHGAIKVNGENFVSNIVFCGSKDEISSFVMEGGNVPVVSGVVFLNVSVAESLLSLHAISPVDSCTYLGLDSGALPLQMSLYFDIFIAMADDVSETDFLSGRYGQMYCAKHHWEAGDRQVIVQNARKILWQQLHRYRIKMCVLPLVRHLYWSETDPLSSHMSIHFAVKESNVISSFVTDSKLSGEELIHNSLLSHVHCKKGSIIQHSKLRGKPESPIKVGKHCFISGLNIMDYCLSVDDNVGIMQVNIDTAKSICSTWIVVGVTDVLLLPYNNVNATYCNQTWTMFFDRTGINPQDLWPANTAPENKYLLTANLFSSVREMADIDNMAWLWQQQKVVEPSTIHRWRQSTRLSIQQILAQVALPETLQARRDINTLIATETIRDVVTESKEISLLPMFLCAVAEGKETLLMAALDNVAASFDFSHWHPGKAARTLACIADLLSCMAGKGGGLRSGPTANRAWKNAFEVLETGTRGSITAGFEALRQERTKWMDQPTKLIRAARHYEGAAQILIRQAVMTASQFITLSPQLLSPIGVWVVAECPARLDLQGGWSDTPPICYEQGGSVVNIAVLIREKRPIGAKVRRIVEPHLLLSVGMDELSSVDIVVKNSQELADYQQLAATGALLKAAIVCAEVVDIKSPISLQDQLLKRYGGGLEIRTWSTLPQGSGLGTSSILAAALLAALWTAIGKDYTRLSIIHAVLYLEQMLTTGGGWQDQVGGVLGGVNRGFSHASLPVRVDVEPVKLPSGFDETINKHLVLIYTGKVRLAKNLLQNVVRNWYARDSEIVGCFQDLVQSSMECAEAFRDGNLEKIGRLMNEYWKLKTTIAPGCDPAFIREMMRILDPYVYGQTLAGAGGGGFIVLLTKSPCQHDTILNLFTNFQGKEKLAVYRAALDMDGITVYNQKDTDT